MKNELLEAVSEQFAGAVLPLFHKKIFKAIPIDKLPLHLTPSNMDVLFLLLEIRSATISELCNHLKISRPNMTPIIDKLVEYKLVERKTSEEDRRVTQISITALGDQLCKELQNSMRDHIKSTFASLENDDLIALKECLATLKTILMKV